MMDAIPIPLPMHMDVQMMRAPERLASASAVAIWRAPAATRRASEVSLQAVHRGRGTGER